MYKLLHDPKYLLNMITSEDTDESKYQSRFSETVLPVNTPSKALNFVFTLKKQEAVEKGIEFINIFNIVNPIKMEDADLYLLLSNLLDNARQHVGHEKKIHTEVTCEGRQLMIRISNSLDEQILNGNHQITVQPDEHHGYVILSVETLLKKYNGSLYFDENHSSFVTLVIIPMD